MSATVESLKASIALHEKLLITSIAILAPLSGWLVLNYGHSNLSTTLSIFSFSILSLYSIRTYRLIKNLIQELNNV